MMGFRGGSLTIFLALTMTGFLTFCLVITEGVRLYFLKAGAEQAIELAEFSVLSEYQYELLQNYGLLFLELDYEQGKEDTPLLKQRMQDYISKNIDEVKTLSLETGNFQRATDNGGQPFFEQAVELMKVRTGYKIFEELAGITDGLGTENVDLGKLLEENTSAANSLLGEYVDEDGSPLIQISLPRVSFPSVKALTEAVLGSESMISDKSVNLEERIMKRKLSAGSAKKEKNKFTEMQLFHGYLFEHFYHYGATNSHIWRSALEYQLEYIIFGKESDRENLENMMWRIFLLRAGGNYLLYHQDSRRLAEAEAEATALAGIFGNEPLIKAVREILLIAQAIEDGIEDTKAIFSGAKVPLYENGIFRRIQMGYEQYLYFFLSTTDQTQKIYRSMDLVELEIREKSGYQEFCLDHCTDYFEVEWVWQTESIFEKLPFLESNVYKNTIRRRVFYEK